MQITKDQLARQQLVMKFLKFYKGKIDGIWGPASIAAKRAWEFDPSFLPAFPNNGLPFALRDATPKGVTFNRVTRLMDCVGMSETAVAELLKVAELKSASTEVKQADTPVTEEPARERLEAEKPVEQSKQQNSQPDSNHHKHNHKHNHNNQQKRN